MQTQTNESPHIVNVNTRSKSVQHVRAIISLFKGYLHFLGRRSLLWLGIGVTSSLALALCDLSFSILLQGLMKALQLLPPETKLFGPAEGWNPGPTEIGTALLSLGLLRSLGQLFQNQSFAVALENMSTRLRLLAVYDLLDSKKTSAQSTSKIHLHISEAFPKAGQFCNHASTFVSLSLQSLAMIVFMFWTSWRETMLGIAGISLIGICMATAYRQVRSASAKIPTEQAALIDGIERVARNWLLVRILKTEHAERSKLTKNVTNYANHSLRAAFMSYITISIAPFFGIILLCILIYVGRTYWNTDGLQLISFLYLFIRFVQNLASQFGAFGNMLSFLPQFQIAYSYFSSIGPNKASQALVPSQKVSAIGRQKMPYSLASPESTVARSDPKKIDLLISKPPSFELKTVSFRYSNAEQNILEKISLNLPAGQQLAVLGASGTGKSTLLCLLLGLLEPTEGLLKINELAPSQYYNSATSRVGYVGVEPFLFAGSIRDNLQYGGQVQHSDSACWHALTIARVDQFVRTLNEGLEYRIDEGGQGLSSGQKQRLSLARAILSQPDVLVLDEASANLDIELESQLADSIKDLKGKTTVIMVSHRPGFVKHSDIVLELPSGRVLVK